MDDPIMRRWRARKAANASWRATPDRLARTAPARAAARSLLPTDPVARSEYFAALARLPRTRSSRLALPSWHYEQVAEVYLEAIEDCQHGKPKTTEAVAETWGVPYSTAQRWVQKARARGLLPKRERPTPDPS